MKKNAIVIGVVIAASSMIMAGASSASESKSYKSAGVTVLKMGAAVSLTGSLAKEGLLTKEGYQFCQTKVNALGRGRLNGNKINLDIQYQDDTSKPDIAAQLVSQFNDKGIKLILSSYGSANVQAQAPVVELNGQVMADSAGSDNKIFQKGYTRTFAVLSPATEYASSIVKAINQYARPKPRTIAFLSADDGFSKTVTEGGMKTAKALGYKVLDPQYFPNGSSDVSSALNKVKSQNPDVIIGSVHLVEGVAIVKQAKELGVSPAGFGESVAPPVPDFAKTLGVLAEGVLGSSQWTETTRGQDKYFGSAKQYNTEFTDQFGHVPDYHNAEATAACLALVLAVEKSQSVVPDKVRDAMAKMDTQSFFGRIKFDSTGQNIYKPMSVIQIQNGKVVTVWPALNAEAKFIWPGNKK